MCTLILLNFKMILQMHLLSILRCDVEIIKIHQKTEKVNPFSIETVLLRKYFSF